MARLILKSPYLKPGGQRSPSGYLKYIATRDGVEMAKDTSGHLPATAQQEKEISALLKAHPDSMDSLEYLDFQAAPTRRNAEEFLRMIHDFHADTPKRDVYLRYIGQRPGSNGLFTDEGVPIVLSAIQKEMNEHKGNIWTHIISLHREDAQRLGYDCAESWMHLLRSQRNQIAQQMKIAPENFRWYAAFHNEGHHPHVHMMAYSIDPHEAYLSSKGIENIKSALAQEIFRQDLLHIYQKQTDIRDELRQESRDRLKEILDNINNGTLENFQLEQMLLQLSQKLSTVKGKKQYGYLNATTKKLVDDIVRELCKDSRIQELYELWYEQKEDVLRTYTDKMPQRIPLEQQKEFKSIRNAVVQAAQQLSPTQEETPLSAPLSPRVDFAESGKETAPEAAQSQPVPTGEQRPPQTTSVALGLLRLFANMIHEDAGRHIRRRDFLDRKQRQKTAEKKLAQGQHISHDGQDNAMTQTM